MRHVLKGLEVLHDKGIPHFNLKMDSILIGNEEAKLTDIFCLTNYPSRPTRSLGSRPMWQAPEVFAEVCGSKSWEADIWSVGILAIQLSTRSTPNSDASFLRYLFQCHTQTLSPPKLEGKFSQDFKDFVSKCTQVNPGARLSVKELLLEPFIVNHKDTRFDGAAMVRHYYNHNPKKR